MSEDWVKNLEEQLEGTEQALQELKEEIVNDLKKIIYWNDPVKKAVEKFEKYQEKLK